MNSALISQIHFIAVGTGWGVPMTFTWNTNIYVSFFLILQCSHWTSPRCWVCSYSGKCSSTFQPRTVGRWGPGKGTLKTALSVHNAILPLRIVLSLCYIFYWYHLCLIGMHCWTLSLLWLLFLCFLILNPISYTFFTISLVLFSVAICWITLDLIQLFVLYLSYS